MVSYLGAMAIFRGFANGMSSQTIWLDDVQCRGTEERLIDCLARSLGNHNCSHFEDAGVRCQTNATSCRHGAVRLQGGNNTQGRVEICINNIWGAVCDDFWGTADAQVVCRQLGFPASGNTHNIIHVTFFITLSMKR